MQKIPATFMTHGIRLGRLALALALALGALALVPPRAAHAAGFTVNSTADTVDAAPGNGVCADAASACTLRAAIMEANALAGADTITLPAGTYTLTRSGSDDNATNGDLDVTGALTISGAGQASTIIQAGTTNSNGIDKILSFNPIGALAGFAVSVSNLTLRFGRNLETYANFNGFGGCLDYDAGTSAAAPGSLTLSSVTVTDCSTTDADGGGLALFLNKGGTVSISNATIQNNRAGTNVNATSGLGGGIFFGTTDSGSTVNVTLSSTTIANNQALGGVKQGGGLLVFGGAGTYNYQLHGVTISGNSAASDGGGIWSTAPLTIDQGSVISGNSSGRSGGGIWLNHANRTSTISGVTIRNNSAVDGGGGIRLDSGAPANNLNLSFTRLANNTAGAGKGSGLSVNNGVATATNNWWGCSSGPSAAPCDTAQVDPGSGGGPAGTGTLSFSPWLRLNLTAATNPLVTGQSTGLTASFLTNSSGGAVSLSNLGVLLGLPVTWSGVGGTISGQQATIQAAGTATASYQATAAAAGNRAVAKVDNDGVTSGSNVVNITVNQASTTTAITTDSPDPSVVGQAVTVNYTVAANAPGAGTPSGNVTVSDGTVSCTGTAAAGTCSITFTSAGAKTLTATYAGDTNFSGSTSAGVAHSVNQANTTTSITADTPDPSDAGQAVTVSFTVAVSAPGAGTPTGNVTVGDGVDSCTGTVASGQCTLTLSTAGARTLTATYAGDSNFNSSASAGVAHTVNSILTGTTTTITSDTPDPSVVGQPVAVSYNVTPQGAGTPTGNVMVSDGVDSCTGTVASGTCSITFTSAGAKTLTATYAGDSSFSGSSSASAAHQVDQADTTTTITSATPAPAQVGTPVTVSFTVAVSAPGAGTPTGNVTVSDGVDSCTGTVASGQCTLTLTTAGARTLTATYAGDSNFNGSVSAGFPHTVFVPLATNLTIAKSHSGNFAQGQIGAQYTIAVSNVGTGASSGEVTVVDTLPAGLTATAIGGAGWSCALATLTCTRSDVLPANDSYPDITLTVDVASAAPANVTNTADVAGGGDADTGNNTANDPTTITSDTTPPDTTIDSQPANPSSSTSASFTFSGTDGGSGVASFECSLDGASFTACASPQSYSSLALGSHTFQVRAIDGVGNTDPTPASYTWEIRATTSMLYNGGQVVSMGSSVAPAARLGSSASTCLSGKTITFALDANPLSGAAGSYTLGSAATNSSGQATMAAVSTAGWIEGVYTISASFAGTAGCAPASDSATLTVASAGNASTGGGWYNLSGSGRVNFGYHVRKADAKCTAGCAYKGQLLLINTGKWKLKGSLTSYVKLAGGKGAANGAGNLYWWNGSLNGGLGDWQLAQAGVSYTINVYDSGKSGKSSTDAFGIRIVYTPVAPQPSALPNSDPQVLKGGDIKVS